MEVVYVVYSKDTIDDYCSVYLQGVYESLEEAKKEAEKCDGWAVDCEFFRKSESESFEE